MPKSPTDAPTRPVDTLVRRFHDHLDECAQCRENPFALCSVGREALGACVSESLEPRLSKVLNDRFWDLI